MSGKYDKYIRPAENLHTKLADAFPADFNRVITSNIRLAQNMVIAYRLIAEMSSWIHPSHSHDYHEYLAWYGSDPENPDDFDAEIAFYIGEEMEKHVITRPTIVSIPPGLSHCPLEVTRLGKPIIQLAVNVINETNDPVHPEK